MKISRSQFRRSGEPYIEAPHGVYGDPVSAIFADDEAVDTPQWVKDAGDVLYSTNTLGLQNDINRMAVGQEPIGVVGGAIGPSSSGGGNQHTVTSEPWAAIRPSLMRGIGTAGKLYYDDQGNLLTREYVGPGDVTQTALDRMRQRGMGDPLQAASESYLTDVLGGGVNPYLSSMYDTAADKVRARLDSQFAQAGRYGSGEHEREMGSALGDLATQMYGGQYNQDMARRMQAAQLAPDIGYQGMERQLRVGEYLDEQKRQAENWDYDQQMQALNDYITQINAIGGSYPSQSQPIYRNKAAETLGLLSGGVGLLGKIAILGEL